MKWFPVMVMWENDTILDAIQGENEEHALENAYWNWIDAIEIKVF